MFYYSYLNDSNVRNYTLLRVFVLQLVFFSLCFLSRDILKGNIVQFLSVLSSYHTFPSQLEWVRPSITDPPPVSLGRP